MSNVLVIQNTTKNTMETWFVGLLLASAFAEVGLSYSHIYLYHVCMVLFLMFLCIKMSLNPYKLKSTIPEYLYLALGSIAVFYAWSVVTLLWAEDTSAGVSHVIQMLVSLVGFFAAVFCAREINGFRIILKIIALVLAIDVAIGFAEALTSFRWPISAYSSSAAQFGYELIYLTKVEDWLASVSTRPTGLHWNTNNYAVVMCGASVFYYILAGRVGKYLALFCGLFLVFSTDSRSILLIFSLIFLVFSYKALLASPIRIVFSLFLGSAIIIGIYTILSLSGEASTRFTEGAQRIAEPIARMASTENNDSDYKDDSINIRKSLNSNSITGAYESSLIGIGAGGSRGYHAKTLEGIRVVRTHNYPLEILLELGIIGLILFMLFMGVIAWWGYAVYKSMPPSKAKNIQKAFLVVFPVSLFSMVTVSSTVYYFPFWVYLGLFLCVSKINFYTIKPLAK